MTWVNLVTPGWFPTMGMRLAGRTRRRCARSPGRRRRWRSSTARSRGASFPGSIRSAPASRRRTSGPEAAIRRTRSSALSRTPSIAACARRWSRRMYLPFAQEPRSRPRRSRCVPRPARPMASRGASRRPLKRRIPRSCCRSGRLTSRSGVARPQERLVATLAGFFGVLGAAARRGRPLRRDRVRGRRRRRGEIGIRMALGASARGRRLAGAAPRRRAGRRSVSRSAPALSLWAAKFIGTLLYGLERARSGDVPGCGRRSRVRRRAGRVAAGAARLPHRPDARVAELVGGGAHARQSGD